MWSKRFVSLSLLLTLFFVFGLASLASVDASAVQPQTSWSLVWADEFNVAGQPSATNWNYNVGNGFNPGAGSFDGWGNGEWEWYRPENCFQQGGNLVLRATWNTTPTTIAGRQWYQFSCRITTDTKRSIQYGAIEARIQMPNNIGTWPAFWMMGDACDDTSTSNYAAAMTYYDTMASNWASCGEIDILEHRNSETVSVHNLFWDNRTGLFPWDGSQVANNPSTYTVGNVANFHTYRFEWTASQLTWLVDGAVAKTQNITPANMEEFRKPFHIIMNLALAGAFPGTQPNQADFPLSVNVDYLRVYQAGSGPTATPTFTPTPVVTTPPPTGNKFYVRSGGALSTTAGTSASTVTVASAGGTNHDGVPTNAQTFTVTGVNGTYTSGSSQFHVYVDSGTGVGNAVQIRVSYDFTNNGSFDRVETYHYFATNDVAGFEDYNHTSFGGLQTATGSYANLSNGRIQIQVWSAIGNASSTVRVNASAANGQQSYLQIPFN